MELQERSEKLGRLVSALALLGALLALRWAAAGEEAGAAQIGTRWVLAEESPARGETVEAWLVVKVSPPRADSATAAKLVPPRPATQLPPTPAPAPAGKTDIRISSPPSVRVWLAAADSHCGNEPAPGGRDPRVTSLSGDGVLRICVEPRGWRPFRLLAEVTPPHGEAEFVASDLLTVRPGWRPGAASVAALSALVGFLLGLFGKYIEKWIEKLLTRRRSRIEILHFVVQTVAREWQSNLELLDDFVGGVTPDPPTLQTIRYGALLADDGALAFLKKAERRRYLRRVESIYGKVNEFNFQVARFKKGKVAQPDLERAGRSLQRLLAANRPPAAEGEGE